MILISLPKFAYDHSSKQRKIIHAFLGIVGYYSEGSFACLLPSHNPWHDFWKVMHLPQCKMKNPNLCLNNPKLTYFLTSCAYHLITWLGETFCDFLQCFKRYMVKTNCFNCFNAPLEWCFEEGNRKKISSSTSAKNSWWVI